jgi:hypothetical protein
MAFAAQAPATARIDFGVPIRFEAERWRFDETDDVGDQRLEIRVAAN